MTISITLEHSHWGQIIDGLICRVEQYEWTAQYHEGESVEEFILEVRDAEEARNIAGWFRRMIRDINQQRKTQRENG